jgi:CBS domain-containing protein
MSELIELARGGAGLSRAADERTRLLIDGFVHSAGPPPARFAWLALGSHARGELHCASDQDHALVWETARAAQGSYARDLAAEVIAGLERFGMRRCDGGYMADTWSRSLPDWLGTLRGYLAAPTATAVLDADIFLDIRPLRGSLDVDPLREVLATGADSPRLLHGLAVAANSFGVTLGAFGRLPPRLDVKRTGQAPLVLLARLYALQARSTAVGTLPRLADCAAAGTLSDDLAQRLREAFDVFTRLRLQHQLAAADRGQPIDDMLDVCALAREDLLAVKESLRAVKAAQAVTAVTFRTDL